MPLSGPAVKRVKTGVAARAQLGITEGELSVLRLVAEGLSNKEIALMLRSGYSSESVLVEIARRGALETLDPTTRKSLLEFRASPQLIVALESNAYAVSVSEAE
jgi:FixJ family two-component response regulator